MFNSLKTYWKATGMNDSEAEKYASGSASNGDNYP
jgi:hypothetical protein